ncbi:glycosyltransferase [Aureibaculum sp. 2210JD6-5]|uniref:glycosyltransferase n=1 Tax=Aureibaculum sp. 2210JD6-5 TaxID=3103957 RepID=UPI002AACCF25|nr:glycosyltransferase [Aureibaculum sp. 2210JD6-5]MDY7394108.1 glycosyltransferase [Aureibaculum sp. 2210JD6-5]
MKLSYIIPLYNAEKYLKQCLDSIYGQQINKRDFEVIVIDDGSTDKSLLKANKIAEQYDNIKVYHQDNKGVSATRNKGIELAKGKYIWFIDSDDYIISDTANLLIECLEKNNLDILEFQLIRTESRALNISIHNNPSLSDIKVLNGKIYASTRGYNESCCTSIYKREFLLSTSLRFIEGRIMEDMAFNAEIVPLSNRIAYFPLDVYRYVINPKSIWTNREPIAFRKSIDDFIFMAKKFTKIIADYQINDVDTKIIKLRQQEMLFNISKRLLMSNYTINELNCIFKDLSAHNLYPIMPYKGKGLYRKLETSIFNKRYLFLLAVLNYRIFKKQINYFIIRKYQRKKEKQIRSINVEL